MSLLLSAICACQVAAAAPDSLDVAALVARARASRYQQDSALASYRVIARQRGTGGIGLASLSGLGPLGRTRTAARAESVARMYWHHRLGTFAEVIAARGVAPIVGETTPEYGMDAVLFALPYAPGQDRLWPMSEMREVLPDANRWIAHPFAAGSDSLYRFSFGGPLTLTLPSGRSIHLREVHVTPRRPDGLLVVGSFWLETTSGALVRAAYRSSIAMDLWTFMEPHFDESDREMVQRFGPFRGNLEEIVIEFGLYGERFWLPRARIAHAEGTARGGRITLSIEQTFSYEEVQALAPGEVQATPPPRITRPDWDESRDDYWDPRRDERARRPCRADDRAMAEPLSVDSIAKLSRLRSDIIQGQRIQLLMPCDLSALVTSPELPPSIYSPGEELFTDTDLQRLRGEVESAIAMHRQAEWAPQPTRYRWGVMDGLMRFNRVEALSVGVRAKRELGEGLSLDAEARLGVADLEPNGEVRLTRTSGRRAVHVGAFRRLAVGNDWGNPHGLANSLGALLWGNDLGVYHRTLGLEAGSVHARASARSVLTWDVFVEQQRSASVSHSFSLARVMAGSDFAPNDTATAGIFAGARASVSSAWGLDPRGFQLSGSLRAEGAGGETDYGRGIIEARLARGARTVVAVLGAAGSSVGTLPAQRRFRIGGPWAVHAYHPSDAAGDAFWTARLEVARGFPIVRTTLFYDLGWVGNRDEFGRARWNARAGGIGAAALDGLVRVDLARRIDGPPRWSVDLYFDIR